jgi:hypothetical protein
MKSTFISLDRFSQRPDLDPSKRDHTTQPTPHFCEYAAFQNFLPRGHRIGRLMLSGKGKAGVALPRLLNDPFFSAGGTGKPGKMVIRFE